MKIFGFIFGWKNITIFFIVRQATESLSSLFFARRLRQKIKG